MKPFLLTELPQNVYNAGYKAKDDIRKALDGLVTDLTIAEAFRLDKIPAFWRLLSQIRRIPVGAELILQCPVYSFFNEKFLPLFCRAVEKRRLAVTLILHDVDTLRYPDRAARLLPVERRLYGLARRIIVHNEAMKQALTHSHGIPAEKMTVLGIFDYLLAGTPAGADEAYTRTVFVAGNLSPDKSGYLYRLGELAQSVPVNLYGGGFDAARAADSLHYMGSFPPDELPARLRGNFGLVWDGDRVDTCGGDTGAYLRINNPHKTSLYLAAGFPVIIWSEAALAPFVTQHGVGLAVDSLEDLPRVLADLSEEDYARLRRQAQAFGARLRQGDFIRLALEI
ncbi:MAG: galactofuranosyltransferase [Clostridia bacterium]|nr:galactofuranosyltransferase [Clostridia bacterium]